MLLAGVGAGAGLPAPVSLQGIEAEGVGGKFGRAEGAGGKCGSAERHVQTAGTQGQRGVPTGGSSEQRWHLQHSAPGQDPVHDLVEDALQGGQARHGIQADGQNMWQAVRGPEAPASAAL